MSIINKMHKGSQAHQENSPILSSIPVKKNKKAVFLFLSISVLLFSSLTLSYLIYDKSSAIKPEQKDEIIVSTTVLSIKDDIVTTILSTPIISSEKVLVKTANVTAMDKPVKPEPALKELVKKESIIVLSPVLSAKQVIVQPRVKVPAQKAPLKKITNTKTPLKMKANNAQQGAYLEIKKSIISASQLASLHLNKAEKASRQGDTQLVAQEKRKALTIQPQLHEVRQSLALYYYSIGEKSLALSLLKEGALKYPKYVDFNLMLSRIALKNGEQQKAYLYLQQHPPTVEGNLDYHVSYAILAQKFKHYEQSEGLYLGLLTQRPANGRWRMSLAIAQDKQDKKRLAVENYQQALLQVDLSSKAKKYINQRLAYLANR